jgi:hypothetical protein
MIPKLSASGLITIVCSSLIKCVNLLGVIPHPHCYPTKSTLNGKSYYSNDSGYYYFGFPQGIQEFEFYINGQLIDIQTITIYPHQNTGHDIALGIELGDVNGDGSLNILDIVTLVNWILIDYYNNMGDMNSDGQLNILDIVQLVNLILS